MKENPKSAQDTKVTTDPKTYYRNNPKGEF